MARRPHNAPPTRDTGPRVNDNIRAVEIRLIGADGENVGVVSPARARQMAEDAGLDLVEISPNANPPVCKIMDFGKFKYEQQKKESEARKKQKIIEVKEVKFRPNTDTHDYDVKMRNVTKFLGNGDKVKVTLRFRGREMAHQDLGRRLLER
ncbi:MAG: translation initiation factor IF-3, partial [Pseudomonadota bacterium]